MINRSLFGFIASTTQAGLAGFFTCEFIKSGIPEFAGIAVFEALLVVAFAACIEDKKS